MPKKKDPDLLITNNLICKAIDVGNKLPKNILHQLSLLRAQGVSDVSALHMLCNLAYVKNVSANRLLYS